MSEKIKITLYNARLYHCKFLEVNDYVNKSKTDIMCLNETWLKPKEYNLNLLKNFTLLRSDRIGWGGGVAILLDKRIKYKFLEAESNFEHEFIAIEIYNNTQK